MLIHTAHYSFVGVIFVGGRINLAQKMIEISRKQKHRKHSYIFCFLLLQRPGYARIAGREGEEGERKYSRCFFAMLSAFYVMYFLQWMNTLLQKCTLPPPLRALSPLLAATLEHLEKKIIYEKKAFCMHIH